MRKTVSNPTLTKQYRDNSPSRQKLAHADSNSTGTCLKTKTYQQKYMKVVQWSMMLQSKDLFRNENWDLILQIKIWELTMIMPRPHQLDRTQL